MGALRDELTVDDLIAITNALRILRPNQPNLFCVGVEVPQPNDQSVVFHVAEKKEDGSRDEFVMMVSAELILEMFGPKKTA